MRMSKREAQGQATRKALLAAAREEFGRHGYTDTSVDEIVRRTGVTKGAFYHHFSEKKELFLRVFEDVKKDLSRGAFIVHVDHEPFAPSETRSQTMNRFSDQTNAEVWRELVERCQRYLEYHLDARVRRIVLIDAHWVLSWDERQRVESEYGVVLLRADLRRAMHRGIIQRLPLQTLAIILVGAMNEACLLIDNASNPDIALDEAMAIIEKLLEGLRKENAADGST